VRRSLLTRVKVVVVLKMTLKMSAKDKSRSHRKAPELEEHSLKSVSTTASVDTEPSADRPDLISKEECSIAGLHMWDSLVEELRDVRPGKRANLLKKLSDFLHNYYIPEQVNKWQDTLVGSLAVSLVKGTPAEAILARDCLCACLITIGWDSISAGVYEDAEKKIIASGLRGTSPLVRGAGSEAMGLLAFMGCNDDAKLLSANKFFVDKADHLIEHHKSCGTMDWIEAEGMLIGWTLLSSLWKTSVLAAIDRSPAANLWDFCDTCLNQSSSPPLTLIAGRCVATIIDSVWALTEFSQDCTDGKALSRGRVLEKIREICRTSGSHTSFRGQGKAERQEETALFRMILSTAESGEAPATVMCMVIGGQQQNTSLNGWINLNRYEIMKKYLRGAIAGHLSSNPAFSYIFGDAFDQFLDSGKGQDAFHKKESLKNRQRLRCWLRDQKVLGQHWLE